VHLPQVLYEESKGEAIITTGVGQHQMFAAQWYPFGEPRRWVTSGGLGSMGFGLPSALGAAAAHDGKKGRPSRVVVDIDGDGSFLMNCQELATAAIEKLNCKVGRGLWVRMTIALLQSEEAKQRHGVHIACVGVANPDDSLPR
jgi:acetolactate synthase-1/2/3 large subunit